MRTDWFDQFEVALRVAYGALIIIAVIVTVLARDFTLISIVGGTVVTLTLYDEIKRRARRRARMRRYGREG